MKVEEVELIDNMVAQSLIQYQISNTIDEEIVPSDFNEVVEFKTLEKVRVLCSKIAKRSLDIVGSLMGIILLMPITLGVAIINILCKENGSLFYTQERIGKDGKLFKLYKFRTMVENADEKLAKLMNENENMRIEYKKYKKLKNDPRITKAGKFLRKSSLDEFPQFINVLKGEMSLVGPRPYLEREKEEMGDYYDYIIKCKPGLTGLWQTSGRNDVTFNDRLVLDYKYYNNNNLKWDIQLLEKTVMNVIKKDGAA